MQEKKKFSLDDLNQDYLYEDRDWVASLPRRWSLSRFWPWLRWSFEQHIFKKRKRFDRIAISWVSYLTPSSTFHALVKATSPAKAVSKTYCFPLISRASLGIPGISLPFAAPPSLYRWGIVPSLTAVQKMGMPAAYGRIRSAGVPWGTSSRVNFPLRNLVYKFLLEECLDL